MPILILTYSVVLPVILIPTAITVECKLVTQFYGKTGITPTRISVTCSHIFL